MMVDASAMVAILNRETDAEELASKIETAKTPITSPLAVYETVTALMRENRWSASEAEATVRTFLEAASIRVVPLTDGMATKAALAFERFGKGRHPAALNLGDCFAYACAQAYHAPLLYKGNDFAQTDLRTPK